MNKKSTSADKATGVVDIRCRYYGGTYIAKAIGIKAEASSTAGELLAVRACALKVFGSEPFTVKPIIYLDIENRTSAIWLAKAK